MARRLVSDRLKEAIGEARVKQVDANIVATAASAMHDALTKANKALKKWDGANSRETYADQFVWEAWDVIRKALGEKE